MDYWLTTTFAFVIILIGSAVQTAIGFGMAIIAAPLLFLINPDYVPGPIILAALFNCLANTYYFRHSISMRGLTAAMLGRIPGCIVGGGILLILSPSLIAASLAILIAFALLTSLANWSFQATPKALFIAGFASGLTGTSTSIGGPPMALIVQNESTDFIRANLAGFFLYSCITSLIILVIMGKFNWQHLQLGLPLVPATLLGNWLAYRLLHFISKAQIRQFTLCLCCIAIISLLFEVFA
ncbi:sulfite exporter TauE/SafE family protein [Spartinivicinus poritis]|uniref:Probable membrane transporter protein n=1 Tax=Spartinivicinus poritis TaxID=2994640 RepID=A0ABT5UE56_9GAMM|nr:sulfite exporter TauE/SafE family protein [Spartinivicinus sp. A2-2]MDE1464665.1 sulfite exporter TauE/SafE family protein [Spartinivicinus sp. A2-2]